MQLELHMDVIDDFVGEAREVLTYAPRLRLRLRAPSFPRLRPLPRPRLVGEACSSLRTTP